MPISNDEFRDGRVEVAGDNTCSKDGNGPIETEKSLITSFLSERPEKAFTEREIVIGVDFTPVFMNRTQHPLGNLSDGLVNFAGDITATAIVINDIDEALDQLVNEGIVKTKEIKTQNGTSVYYSLA